MEEIKDDGSRTRLLKVATKLFAEKGLEGVSTRDIAKEAELNISLISYYFGGKEGLYLTVIQEFAEQMKERFHSLLNSVDQEKMTRESFVKTMRVFIKGMLAKKFTEPDMSRLIQREIMAGLPYAKEVFEKTLAKIPDDIAELYKAAQKKGIVKSNVHPYILFFSMVHSTDMYVHMSNCRPENLANKILKIPEQLDEYTEQIFLIYVEGVLA
jgi:AcrR family transcriptional regulator